MINTQIKSRAHRRPKKFTLERLNEILQSDYNPDSYPEIHNILSEFVPWYCSLSGCGYVTAYNVAKELEFHYDYHFCKNI